MGIGIIVFGSGGARRIPEGFDRQRAHGQLVAFCRMVGPIAREHGVIIAVEPCDFALFFDALRRERYKGRISIEGTIPHPEAELPAAIAMMRERC